MSHGAAHSKDTPERSWKTITQSTKSGTSEAFQEEAENEMKQTKWFWIPGKPRLCFSMTDGP